MKATGIIRRIDDLGRVVIPREIRNRMEIREGEPLEIFTDTNGVYFKKVKVPSLYSALDELYDQYFDVFGDSNEIVNDFCSLIDKIQDKYGK